MERNPRLSPATASKALLIKQLAKFLPDNGWKSALVDVEGTHFIREHQKITVGIHKVIVHDGDEPYVVAEWVRGHDGMVRDAVLPIDVAETMQRIWAIVEQQPG